MSPVPGVVQIALGAGVAVLLFATAQTSWSPTAKTVAVVGVAAVATLVLLRYQRRLPRGGGPELAPPGEVMPGARRSVTGFEVAGFRHVGAYRWGLRGRLVIATVLGSPGLESYAIVTDRVVEVVSRFGERLLVTTNSGRAPTPATVLRQVVPDGDTANLVRAHDLALEHLQTQGLLPDRFTDDDELMRFVRDVEEEALRRGRIPSFTTLLAQELRGESDPAIGDDDASRLRVESWLAGEV